MNFIVVLGEKLPTSGDLSQTLKNRLDKAISIHDGKQTIIVSGGRVQKNCLHTEAYIMKKYLVEQGIPSEKIVKEVVAKNTVENPQKTAKIIKKCKKVGQIVIISSAFHMARVRCIFRPGVFRKCKKICFSRRWTCKIGAKGQKCTRKEVPA